jgi:lysophospholipase L1-like esterase
MMLRGVLVLLPVLALCAVEGGARLYFHLRFGVPGHVYGMSKYDPVLGAAPRENSYSQTAHLNDFGFRNSEPVFEPKPAGSLRLITYGGSTTFCHHLTNDEAWPIRLQAIMRSTRPGGAQDQVLNGGVVAWSLGHSAERIRRDVPRLRPDAVVIYTGVNERTNAEYLAREGAPMRELVARGDYGRFTPNLAPSSPFRDVIIYKFLRDRLFVSLQKWLHPTDQSLLNQLPVDPDVMTNYLETMRQLVTYLRSEGVTPIVVREVYDPDSPTAPENKVLTSYSTAAAKVAADWGALVVDPTRDFQEATAHSPELFQYTGVHVTVAGAELMAEVLYRDAVRLIGAGR